jgi:hypothetical protein
MRTKNCGTLTDHGRHEWYWRNILRRHCPGVLSGLCADPTWHGPHWNNLEHSELCRGVGLCGICPHGIQWLDHCDECAAEQATTDTPRSSSSGGAS